MTLHELITLEGLQSRMSMISSKRNTGQMFHPGVAPSANTSTPCNVIIFGETGTGKSSVVNLIAGRNIAKTSSHAARCTFASKHYPVEIGGHKFRVWDTVGLNEPGLSNEDYLRAIKEAYKLIKELEQTGGVNILLLCMRGRITKTVQQNYNLFSKILCEKQVPMGIVVTNLENEPSMDEWWHQNEHVFQKSGILTHGYACITASPGVGNIFLDRYKESKETMHRLLLALSSPNAAWKKEKRSWLIHVLGKTASMLHCQHRHSGATQEAVAGRLVKECKFSQQDAVAIAASIHAVRNEVSEVVCNDT